MLEEMVFPHELRTGDVIDPVHEKSSAVLLLRQNCTREAETGRRGPASVEIRGKDSPIARRPVGLGYGPSRRRWLRWWM